MTIQTLYRVQCQPCERYLAPESIPMAAKADSSGSPLFLTFGSAYHEAVRRGWVPWSVQPPLICPDCAADRLTREE